MDFAAVDSIKNVISHGTELMMEKLAICLVSSLVMISQIKYSPSVNLVKLISSVRLKSTIHDSAILNIVIGFKTEKSARTRRDGSSQIGIEDIKTHITVKPRARRQVLTVRCVVINRY